MQTVEDFARLMERVREGSAEAIEELVERFGEHILYVVRRRLNQKLRSKFDSTDFSQDVWASFFAVSQEHLDFKTPEALQAYLGTMARNKVIEAVRLRLLGKRYNVQREQSLNDSTANLPEYLDSGDPTPSQVVGAAEQWERMQDRTPTRYLPLLEMLRAGRSLREIARALQVDVGTVRRVVQKLTQS
jgi:RNA polymerase sigma-70 factor (ECF subfamily)